MTFDERYARLNAAQREAVDTIEGPVMVIAGPGTGKTTILTLRIANILRRTDTPPSGILAITYTEAGVKAIRMKLREVIGARADEVRIHTFHGFAASVIAEFDDHFAHLSGSQQITDIEAEAIIRDILKDPKYALLRPLGEPEHYVPKILRAIGEAKGETWTPEMLRTFAREESLRIQNDPASISSRGRTKGALKADAMARMEKCRKTGALADVYAEYEQRKRAEKKMDFDDLIIELLVAMKQDELLLRQLQEKFLYLLVDEHQDTNDAQNLLVKMIADFFESPNLFVVGDEKQAIYRFQGASVENFLSFQGIWKGMKVISLTENYRSHQSILDAGFAMIEANYAPGEHEALRVQLRGTRKPSQPLTLIAAGNREAEEARLADDITRITSAEPEASVAVIVRRNADVMKVLSALESRGIRASSERGADIFTHPAGVLFFSLARFLADPSETEALAQTIAGGLWGLSFSDSSQLIRSIRSGDMRDVSSRIPALSELMREKSRLGSVAYLSRAAELSGFTARIAADPLSVEVWRGILALACSIADRSSLDDPSSLMKELLAHALSAETKSVKVGSGPVDAQVRVMTAHGSKGLEFDYVFMPYAVEESWMPRGRGSSFVLPRERGEGDDVRDGRRLFYVGLTRARKHVTLSLSAMGADGKELTPLRFLGELPPEHVAREEIPAAAGMPKTAMKSSESHEAELSEYAKRSLVERGLSPTALNHFLACPSAFFYKSILRLPEPPATSSERGNAMHEAISSVWKLSDRSEQSVREALLAGVESYLSRSLLPSFDKDALRADLAEAVPEVASSLSAHFASTGEIATETWAERQFAGSYDGKPVDLRVHGKLDLVLTDVGSVSIFDYKTREAMSENEIKGLTKSSSGDYFRQLVFYRYLLESDPKHKGKSITPSLVFVRPDAKGRCPIVSVPVVTADVEALKGSIQSLIESVWSGKLVSSRCSDEKCSWCRMADFRAR